MRFVAGFLLIFTLGCGSAEKKQTFMLPDTYEEGDGDPAGLAASSMHIRKPMPVHKKNEDSNWDFYFKHCSVNGRESYFSKTSYDCTGPYY